MSLLRTRLFKPGVSKGYLVRERLIERMNASRDKSIHKVIAAAGYGKSIFLSQWLDEIEDSRCWITLEKDCNDIGVFLNYFIEAIKSIDRTVVSELTTLESALELPHPSELAKTLINALDQLTNPATIVLDDYHTITNQEIHEFLTDLLNHFPEQHHIVVSSRFDPPLDLRRLLAYDRVNEIRMADLMFTEEEIIALSQVQSKKAVSRETAEIIFRKTEGWIVPIRLWLKDLSTRKKAEALDLDKDSKQTHRLIHDLLEDVFSALDSTVKKNLMLASLFPRFSIDMLRGLHEILHPEEEAFDAIEPLLGKLLDRSLFIMSLDDEKNWYRFHHLVQEFLQARSKRNFAREIFDKSVDYVTSYFAAHDSIYEAIQLSIAYEDYDKALELFERDRYTLIDNQRFDQLRIRLKLFPEEVIESSPSLLLISANQNALIKNLDQTFYDLDRVKSLLNSSDQAVETNDLLWGEYYGNLVPLLFFENELDRVLQYSRKAMKLLQGRSSYLYYYALSFNILTLNASGKPKEARAILGQHREQLKNTDSLGRMHYNTLGALFGFIQGRLSDSIDQALIGRKLAVDNANYATLLMVNFYASLALYQRNELERGLQYVEEALNPWYMIRPTWIIECFFLKYLFHMANSEDTRAAECLDEMLSFQDKFRSRSYKNLTAAMQTELFLRRGEAQKAWDTWNGLSDEIFSYNYHYFQSKLTEVKLLMAEHSFQNLERAEELIGQYETHFLATCNQNLYFQTVALKIILFQRKQDSLKAMSLLRALLPKTKQESIIRLYTDHGKPMKSLIDKLLQEDSSDSYILKIAQSFQGAPEAKNSDSRIAGQVLYPEKAIAISKKESQILHLISEGYQNKEIAEKLYYSLGTIKTYIYNLYQKIGVSNRAQAIRFYKETGSRSRGVAQRDMSHS